VLLSVVSSSQTMKDIAKPDGQHSFRGRIAKKLNKDPIQVVGVPITSVVDYDIEAKKLQVNEKYDLFKDLNKQLFSNESSWKYDINLDELAVFGTNLVKHLGDFIEDPDRASQDKRKMH
jgi:hypothetical protein